MAHVSNSADFTPYRQISIGTSAVLIYKGKTGNRHVFITNEGSDHIHLSNDPNFTGAEGSTILPNSMVDLSTLEYVDLTQDIYCLSHSAAPTVVSIMESSYEVRNQKKSW
jgi:hypothetical protein